jgi:hypothetical protein
LEELKVEPVDKKLRKYKSNWLHNLTRMNNNRMQKIVLNYNQMDEDEFIELRRDSFIV